MTASKQEQVARARTLAASGLFRTRKELAAACGLHESTLRRHRISPALGPAASHAGSAGASLRAGSGGGPAAGKPHPGVGAHQFWPVEYFGDVEHAAVLPHTATTSELECSLCDEDTEHWRSVMLTPDKPGSDTYDKGALTTLWICTVCRTGFVGEA